jgi:hypothetical protein
MDKRTLSERDICTTFITPALRRAGWDEMLQIREEVGFTKGRIIVRGKLVTRGQAKRADYILYFKPNIPLALIEATSVLLVISRAVVRSAVPLGSVRWASTMSPCRFSVITDSVRVVADGPGLRPPRQLVDAPTGADQFSSSGQIGQATEPIRNVQALRPDQRLAAYQNWSLPTRVFES